MDTTQPNPFKKAFIGSFDLSMLPDLTEFQKRYQDTWVFLTTENIKDHLVYCKNVDLNNTTVTFKSTLYDTIVAASQTDVQVSVRWPETGVFNYETGFMYATRLPERQWKRAPCSKSILFFNPLRALYEGSPLGDYREEVLASSYAPRAAQESNILAVINEMKGTDVWGRVLSDNFALSLPPYKKAEFILWYGYQPVGVVTPQAKTISVEHSCMLQEVLDYNHKREDDRWTVYMTTQ